MASSETVVLTYGGGLAESGRMLLYEYGRSQYAFSRILTTVERYRRSKIIIDRVSSKQRVNLVVTAPRRGSFKLDVDVDTSEPAADGQATFETLFAVVLDRLIPPGEEFSEVATKLAKIKLRELESGLADSEFPGERVALLQQIADGELYHEGITSDLLRWALGSSSRAITRTEITREELARDLELVDSDIRRKRLVEKFRSSFPASDIDKLAARVRPIFTELAVPLGKSADIIRIGSPAVSRKYYTLDLRRLDSIKHRLLDEEEFEIDVKIKNFDVESEHGSLRSDEFKGVRRFALDPAAPPDVKDKIIAAMQVGSATIQVVQYTDANGVLTSYLVRDVF
ncbi:MAG: hypothetical protein Q8K11_14545 [Phenylobacterium sp.]|uniref:hypothetical protein n=1 Tax=Phenylobacterium sp. TaxID=1871053 RepID=UPI002731EF65|nr:hypothetical protein [Phenylobacterium sp.]MDP2011387.1 hypothetical protein [Phenylobacterium sp.]